ncbi:hypothetical protein HH212_05630 [Massilia forsythiae]|uniref:Uncharacterized protein n=1 Tax=Massilia forsythiae TaxID=2728020 RepID=A0A7Z2VUL4_9BURK|nr:hypothetical protein [Massilia forsythiae]QJD99566.1 hypothetical protein HH212_05630 [Massilia forsythiae]
MATEPNPNAAAPNVARTDEHFFSRLLRGILPLLVWIAHFAFCYGLAAAQCTPAAARAGGPDRLTLGLATLAALAACAWLAWRARGVLRREDGGLLDWAAFLGALLATVAVAWNGVPVLLVAGCA